MVQTRLDSESLIERFGARGLERELKNARVQLAVAKHHSNTLLEAHYSWYESTLLEALGKLRAQLRCRHSAVERGSHQLSAQAVKERHELVDYIGNWVVLKHCGIGRYVGKCPFHADTHPSLFVYSERQDWYCYGCNKGGDIFNFVQLFYGVEFIEALKILNEGVCK